MNHPLIDAIELELKQYPELTRATDGLGNNEVNPTPGMLQHDIAVLKLEVDKLVSLLFNLTDILKRKGVIPK